MMNEQSMMGNASPEGMPGMAGPEMPMEQQAQDPNALQEAQQQEQPDPEAGLGNLMDFALSEANLAKRLVDKKDKEGNNILDTISAAIMQGYEEDETSREDWLKMNKEWLNLALLIRENKTTPWPKASNVKYPLIATAAMQFSARAYPALVPQDGKVVKAKVLRKDKQGLFQQKAIRVALHMSYQVMYRMPNWEEDMDKLLMTLAVSGVCFKKTYYDSIIERAVSQIVYPENLCVNYYAKSIEKAYRKTEILQYYNNEIIEKVNNNEIFLDIEYTAQEPDEEKVSITTKLTPPPVGKSTPHTFLACHTYWDLDEDGYEEPYIITLHKATGKVVRIIARWDSDGYKVDDKGKVLSIKPVEYFTTFTFIPNSDGSLYGAGFGMLLGPLNESVNTLINQLVDSGTLNNLSGGFVGKNLRIKMGQMQIKPGQWTVVNATGDDMKSSFFPIPTKEPSSTLFQLMNMLIASGNQLASIAEIMVGKMPGQNTPAGTTQEAVQQSMAVFTAIYKRTYRSLDSEFNKLFRLNRITPAIVEQEKMISGEELLTSDYEGTEDFIMPGADPTGDSAAMRMGKLQSIGQLMQMGTLDPMAYTKRVLEYTEIPAYEELLAKPQPPQPDPKAMESQAKAQLLTQKGQQDAQAHQQKMEAGAADVENKRALAMIKQEAEQMKLQFEEQKTAMKLQGDRHKSEMDTMKTVMEQHFQKMMGTNKLQESALLSRQKLQQGAQAHSLNMVAKQRESQAKIAQKRQEKSSTNGSKQS